MHSPEADDDARRRTSRALHAAVQQAIADDTWTDARFAALALAIACHQHAFVAPVSRLWSARGLDPQRQGDVADLVGLPTAVFKLARVAAHPKAEDVAVFRTSGTTADTRGAHPLATLDTYDAAALAWAAPHLWPAGRSTFGSAIVLAPPYAQAQDSSLSYMIARFVSHLGLPASHHVDVERKTLDLASLGHACAHARQSGTPVLVFGTSFAYVWAIEADEAVDLRLPEGSTAMLTGGFKGKTREVDEASLRTALAQRFGMSDRHVVGEYGMTELSSQLYDGRRVEGCASPGLYRPPPWMRVVAVDPETHEALPDGREGLARFVDLANVDSALVVQTSDRVRVTRDGVALLGRGAGAEPRGCSLAIEELAAG